MDGYKINIQLGKSGDWRVEKFTVTPEDEKLERLRAMFSSSSRVRFVPAGEYTRLVRSGTVVMSDTPNEIDDLREAIRRAHGRILVNGLGLGVYVNIILNRPKVEHVTVVEISQNVIDLVGKQLAGIYGERLKIIQHDALSYDPPRGEKYNAVWHDIWDNICADNLPQMKVLHRKYGRRAEWQGSWCREYL